MGIPTPPPQTPQPPAEVNTTYKQWQDQLQEQEQNNTIGELLQQQRTNSDADSDSRSESTSVNSAQQSNIQINQSSNRIDYKSFKIPETSLNING